MPRQPQMEMKDLKKKTVTRAGVALALALVWGLSAGGAAPRVPTAPPRPRRRARPMDTAAAGTIARGGERTGRAPPRIL